jgi:hypothetical protein
MNLKSISRYFCQQYLRFSQPCCRRLKFPEMWSCVILPIVPICLNYHSAFVFRAKQHKNKILLGWLDHQMKTLQFFNTLGTTCHRHSVTFHNFWTFFLTCTSQNILYYQKMDNSVTNVSLSSSRNISNKSKYLPTVACRVVTLCSPGGYILLLYAECTLKMKTANSHKIFAYNFQIT